MGTCCSSNRAIQQTGQSPVWLHEQQTIIPPEHVQYLRQETRHLLGAQHVSVQSSNRQRLLLAAGAVTLSCLLVLVLAVAVSRRFPFWGPPIPAPPGAIPRCGDTPCPTSWQSSAGGYFCPATNGCRPATEGPFPSCSSQCYVGDPPQKFVVPATASQHAVLLDKPGYYDLRVIKGGRLVGCAAPISLLPGNSKYGCSGPFGTAKTCDAAVNPVKDTAFVAAVHAGCDTQAGHGTYGYAYDDGVGLKQCSPLTRYEWVLCPTGSEGKPTWAAVHDPSTDTTRRFRVTNKCAGPVWIQQAGALLPGENVVHRIEPQSYYTYAVPNKGLPSTRFLPKTGCDAAGDNCDIQSMPPCPLSGCDRPIDTKFEASFGCIYAQGTRDDVTRCSVTGQGNPSTYQDWWDGSAVDGWTLPFSILVDDGGHGLVPGGGGGSSDQCVPVVCSRLDAATLCPQRELLTP